MLVNEKRPEINFIPQAKYVRINLGRQISEISTGEEKTSERKADTGTELNSVTCYKKSQQCRR